jgi:monosaccharide-transporting ATPase
MSKELLTMRHITKNFPGVRALFDVDFTLRSGEIHALMGENGAGKSTLIKVLTGVEDFEEGEVLVSWMDQPLINHSPQEAQKNGISTVYQEINLCPNLSVAENIFIGREPKKNGMIDWKKMNDCARKLLADLNLAHIDVTKSLEHYSVAIQQMVAIARAVDIESKILIFDEPTSSLDEQETEKLFQIMRQLKDKGVGIIFITHFLEQVYQVCDRITVLRNGELVGEYLIKDLPRVQLVAKMLGKDFDDLAAIKKEGIERRNRANEVPLITAKNIGHRGTIKPFNAEIFEGEVIGLTGLLGSGRSEMVRSIYGADRPDSGELSIKGKKKKITAPIDAMKAGMGFLPEDRKAEGIISDLSVRENINIALQTKRGMFRPLNKKEQADFTEKYIKLLQIKVANPDSPVKQLSGGNQQKVILARWLLTHPDFLILDEPTRGIDVGTKTEIQKLVLKLAEEGMTIMFISSEVDEMLRTVGRMYVLRDGELVGELAEDQMNENAVMAAIAGGEKDE